jgi:hypothetical protein
MAIEKNHGQIADVIEMDSIAREQLHPKVATMVSP